MLGFGIRYLMEWAMAATDGANKGLPEWPPHPDRVFMALAAAWFETGQCAVEGEALRWLEQLPPPGIYASDKEDRLVVTSYVPVNDTSVAALNRVAGVCRDSSATLGKFKDAGLAMLPEFRSRQPRSFPIAIPHEPVVHLVWDMDYPAAFRVPLQSLCRKVTSIGHSASLVQMWLCDEPPLPNLVPRKGAAHKRMRVFGPGRLNYLEERCNRSAVIEFRERDWKIKKTKGREKKSLQEKQRKCFPTGEPVSLRPDPSFWHGYERPEPPGKASFRGSNFDPRLVILTLNGKRLALPSTLKLTEALRGSLFAACPEPLPEWLSGHAPGGGPTTKQHIALIPLPFVGCEHADGRLMGVALALPHGLDGDEVDRVLTPWLWDEYGAPKKIKLFNGQWLECTVEQEARESPPASLRKDSWTKASRQWATVTPLVLDRHFDGKNKWEMATASVKDSCERIGLPRPHDVLLHPVSMFEGVPRSNEFPWLTRKKDGGRLHHIHALIRFDEEIQGPVIIGAGRFRGYGLCRPLMQEGNR